MFGLFLLGWIGMAGVGIWYFSLYSWDKHPIPLGICVVLFVLVFWIGHVLLKRTKSQRSGALNNFLQFLCIGILTCVLEYIEFGSIYLLDCLTKPPEPIGAIRGANLGVIAAAICHIPLQLYRWFTAKRDEYINKESGRDTLICEAIARFDPVTMTADEPEVEAKPFPRHWIWIFGLYAAAIVVMGCLGVLLR